MDFFFIVHVLVCVLLVAVILFQDGKAGGLTSVSDSGQSMFGAKGAASFLTKLTSGLAICFMVTSLFLNFSGTSSKKSIADSYKPATETSEVDNSSVKPTETAPAEGETSEPAEGEAAADTAEEAPEAKAEGEENESGDN